MFFKKKNDNNIDNNDKNAIDIKNVENNNNNNKKKNENLKTVLIKSTLKNGSYSSVMIDCFRCYHYCYKYDRWKSSFKVYAAGYQLRETLHHR